MHDAGRMTTHLHHGRRQDDWRRADERRRLHTRPEVSPAPATDTRPKARFAVVLRRIPGRA